MFCIYNWGCYYDDCNCCCRSNDWKSCNCFVISIMASLWFPKILLLRLIYFCPKSKMWSKSDIIVKKWIFFRNILVKNGDRHLVLRFNRNRVSGENRSPQNSRLNRGKPEPKKLELFNRPTQKFSGWSPRVWKLSRIFRQFSAVLVLDNFVNQKPSYYSIYGRFHSPYTLASTSFAKNCPRAKYRQKYRKWWTIINNNNLFKFIL